MWDSLCLKGILFSNTPVAEGNPAAVKQILHSGANPNELGILNKTPLHIAVQKENLEIVHILLAQTQIDASIVDESGKTPLTLRYGGGSY